MTGELALTVTAGADPRVYELAGVLELGGETQSISGFAIVNRKGEFVASLFGDAWGSDSGMWGKISAGTSIKASGVSLDDSSKIRVGSAPSGD